MLPITIRVALSVVCVCLTVSVLGMWIDCAKTEEPIGTGLAGRLSLAQETTKWRCTLAARSGLVSDHFDRLLLRKHFVQHTSNVPARNLP